MSSGQDYRYRRILDCTEEEASALMEDLKQKGSRRRITPISAEYLNAYTASKSRQMAHKEACKAEQAGKPAPFIAEQFKAHAAECERSARAFKRGEVFLPTISPSRPPAPESMTNSWAKPPGLYPGPRTLPPPPGLRAPPRLQAPPGLGAPAAASESFAGVLPTSRSS
ncbi:hypothetical protein OH76DRAFT_1398331 [Lentinus brumalis]|uniref:Uncharacterized protein n=1 Tax=Lentinus brumalis TaxID=2498619 RepID=A0A371DNF2_9APHY|nr:hypothetical protein OH76DRAFT_1398331 [Polyporus brumalis]